MSNNCAVYQPEAYWLVKDKAWLAERKAKWQRIAARFKMLGATGSEMRLYEQYYVKGNLKFVDNRQQPELSLAEQLAWHPSANEAVWWQVVAMNAQEFNYFEEGYRFLGYNGVVSVRPEEYSPEIDNTVLNGRDVELYQFFFRNTAWLQYIQQLKHSASVQSDFRSAKHKLETELSRVLSILDENVLKQIILFDSLPLQCLPHLHESYTTNRYELVSGEPERFASFCSDFKFLAALNANREHQPAQQRQIIEAYAEQLEKSAPEWQALWQQLKEDALANYQPPAAAAKPQQPECEAAEPEQPEPTSSPDAFAAEPWPGELVALKQHLEQQGYPVTTTEADANAILQQHFANRCVYFGSFIESMQLETEDYDKPYPAFTAPLQALCDIKGDAKFSYTRRGERITIKVNGERLGVADLEEPAEDEDTSAYFAAIIRLAQQWFPGQVFAYGYESLHLYILPTELVSWLEANGFTNSLNYFGGAATAEQPLAGVTLVFTGVFSAGSREEMEDEAEQLGANVQKAVNSKTKYLVCGSKVGASKLAKAEALGVQVLTEAEYQAMISQGDSDPDYLCNAQTRSWQVVAKKLKGIELQLFELVRNGLDFSYQQGLFATESAGDLILSVTKNFISRRGWIRVGFSPLGTELRLNYEALVKNGPPIQDELIHTVTLSTKWLVNQDELDELLLLLCQSICNKLKWVNEGG